MVKTYKISAELFETAFGLIAIHSTLPHYTLAYHINGTMGISLNRLAEDHTLGEASYPVYEWYNEKNDTTLFLFSNKTQAKTQASPVGLFGAETITNTYALVQELSDVDYFVRIDSESSGLQQGMLRRIKEIDNITISYSIDVDNLKSKHNLIL